MIRFSRKCLKRTGHFSTNIYENKIYNNFKNVNFNKTNANVNPLKNAREFRFRVFCPFFEASFEFKGIKVLKIPNYSAYLILYNDVVCLKKILLFIL